MGLEQMYVKDFKCFKSRTITDFGSLCGLTGANSSGKSTLIQAFVFVIGGLSKDFHGEELEVINESTLTLRRRYKRDNVRFDDEEEEEDHTDDEEDEDEEEGEEEDEEYDDFEDEDEVSEEDMNSEYWIEEKKVSRKRYMKAVLSLNFYFNRQVVAVINSPKIPNSNKELSQLLEKYADSEKHGSEMRRLAVERDAAESQLRKLEKMKEDLEKERRMATKLFLLTLFSTDESISENEKAIIKQENAFNRVKDPTKKRMEEQRIHNLKAERKKFYENRLNTLRAAKRNKVNVPLVDGQLGGLLSSSNSCTPEELDKITLVKIDYGSLIQKQNNPSSSGNVKQRISDLRSKLTGIQLDGFTKIEDIPTLIEKELSCQELIEKAERTRRRLERKIDATSRLRLKHFNKVFEGVAATVGEYAKEMFGEVVHGINLYTKNSNCPWKGVRCKLVESGGVETGIMSCSGGQKRMIYLATMFSILALSKSPIVFIDQLDHGVHFVNYGAELSFKKLINFLADESESTRQIIYAVSNRETTQVLQKIGQKTKLFKEDQ
uniref:SMC_N domain-containing protein n=1 Tax=Caenorhabditis tropicalis TaxID=1561998 RepID=A0A1I7TZ94_9PELO